MLNRPLNIVYDIHGSNAEWYHQEENAAAAFIWNHAEERGPEFQLMKELFVLLTLFMS